MRLWTLHPRYLDPKGLVALWREALLAQKVLQGKTRGYRFHPQLRRFRDAVDPLTAIACYLAGVYEESVRRGYHFDATKIAVHPVAVEIEETLGQVRYEWAHLMAKLARRAPELHAAWMDIELPEAHPMFCIVAGDVRAWERR